LAADTSPEGEQERQIVKQTREQLGSSAEQHLYEWRINACDLTYDCLQLLAMAEVELQSTKAAMKKFDEKMKALKSGGGIGKILGYQSEQLRQLQQLDRMTNPSGPDAAAVEDPTAYAQSRVDQIDAAHSLFAQFCDLAMSDEAYDPDKFRLHSAKL